VKAKRILEFLPAGRQAHDQSIYMIEVEKKFVYNEKTVEELTKLTFAILHIQPFQPFYELRIGIDTSYKS